MDRVREVFVNEEPVLVGQVDIVVEVTTGVKGERWTFFPVSIVSSDHQRPGPTLQPLDHKGNLKTY